MSTDFFTSSFSNSSKIPETLRVFTPPSLLFLTEDIGSLDTVQKLLGDREDLFPGLGVLPPLLLSQSFSPDDHFLYPDGPGEMIGKELLGEVLPDLLSNLSGDHRNRVIGVDDHSKKIDVKD
jgi:hypothetical protein